MDDKKVSIVVPCYNQASYLMDALESIQRQTYSNWECIIVNDGSEDETNLVAEKYVKKDARFRYVYQDNKGLPGARNTGLLLATGEFVFSLDSDDMIEPSYIEEILSIFAMHPTAKIVYTQLRFFGAWEGVWDGPAYTYDDFIWYNVLPPCAVYRRTDFLRVGGYNEWMKKGLEDWDFWLKLLTPIDLVWRIDKPLYLYRKRSTNEISLLEIAQKNKREVMSMLYANHQAIYERYKQDIIYFHSYMQDNEQYKIELSLLKKELECCKDSKAYRLGKFLLSPFAWLKRKLK